MSPAGAPTRPACLGRRRAALVLLGALGLSLACYWPALRGELVYDDVPLLEQSDCHRRGLAGVIQLFDPRRQDICSLRPVRLASFSLDHALFGDEVLGYHLHNVLLHALVAWLAVLLLLRLTGDRALALIAGGALLLHPIATEAVAYVSGRRDLLMALFCLCCALGYLAYRERGGLWRLGLTLLSLALAVLSHESAAALPAALALLEVCLRLRPLASPRPRQRYTAALGAALRGLLARRQLAALGGLFALALGRAAWMVLARNPSERAALWGPDLGGHVGTVLRMHAHYLRQLALPTDLIADYSPEAFRLSTSLTEPAALGALALVGGLIAAALWLLPRRPLVSAAVLGYFTLLLPTSQLVVHHELAAEHRLYLPALCFCALLAAGLRALAARSRLGWGLIAALALTLGLLTLDRARVWSSAHELWSTTVGQVPRCARARTNLGAILAREAGALARRGRTDEARRRYAEARAQLETALQIRPGFCGAQLDLGLLLVELGEVDAGLARLRSAASCAGKPSFLRQLAEAARRHGRSDLALSAYRACLRHVPGDAEALYGLGRTLQDRGDLSGALDQYRRAARARPDWPRPTLREAMVLAQTCRHKEARAAARRFAGLGAGPAHELQVRRLTALIDEHQRRCPR